MTERRRTVVITGASSGLGEALAVHYANEGSVLGLIGRDRERLERVAERCRARGAETAVAAIDVRERAAMAAWLADFDRSRAVDLLIANAGVVTAAGRGALIEEAEASRGVVETNFLGTLNAVHPLLPLMLARGHGQIAIVSSIAALFAVPDAPSYSASKAALLTYGLALRSSLHPAGVRVNVACPGYIATPMMAGMRGLQPMQLSAETAARRMVNGLERDRAVIAYPVVLAAMARLGARLPDPLRRPISNLFRFHLMGSP